MRTVLPVDSMPQPIDGGRMIHSCPVCEGTRFTDTYIARDRHYGIPGLHRVVRCAECSLIFLNPMFVDEQVRDLYPSDYYAYQDNFQERGLRHLLKKILGYYVSSYDPKFEVAGTMLDLGCGSGWFIHRMREQGWTTYGVE